MYKKGFTLMELLLVVSILSIIAAAAAPTFTSGANDSFNESKKANFYNAYQQTVSGANIMMGIVMAQFQRTGEKGSFGTNEFLPAGLSLDAGNQWKSKINGADELRNLNFYVPVTSRVFYTLKGKQLFFSAKIGNKQEVIFYWVDPKKSKWNSDIGLAKYYGPAATQSEHGYESQEIILSSSNTLEDVWNSLKDKE